MLYAVVDPDSGQSVGPFATEDQAKDYFIELARSEDWVDTIELIEKTGLPFMRKGDPFVFTGGRAEQLQLIELEEPVMSFVVSSSDEAVAKVNERIYDYLDAAHDEGTNASIDAERSALLKILSY